MSFKRILVCACLCASGFVVHAAPKQLNVQLHSGKVVALQFDDNSAIRFVDGCWNIESDETTKFLIGEVDNIYFSEVSETGITAPKANYVVALNNGNGIVELKGAQGKKVELVNANGAVLFCAQRVDSDLFSVPVPATKGVYLLKVDNQSFKIIKF